MTHRPDIVLAVMASILLFLSGLNEFSPGSRSMPGWASLAAARAGKVTEPAQSADAANDPFGDDRMTPAPRPLRGINLSGGEFGSLPGKMHKDYAYPAREDLAQFAEAGFNVVRLPFRWERLQPGVMSDLSQADRRSIRQFVDHATMNGFIVILDMHNYARRTIGDKKVVVGSAGVSSEALADAWLRIMEDYRQNEGVWIGLMNEPHGVAAEDWWGVAQSVVLTLRREGVTNKILVSGTQWSGAWTWHSSKNAKFAERFEDPRGNVAFELHQYLDADGSGTSGECEMGSAGRVDAAIEWAERTDARLFFGEIAAGGGAHCAEEYGKLLARLEGSPAVIGWTAWGAGAWWRPDYPFLIAYPRDGRDLQPHAGLLAAHMTK